MRANLYCTYMLLLALTASMTIGRTSAEPKEDPSTEWIPKNGTSVDLFAEAFRYMGAIINQGIRVLRVPPLDPYFMNVTLEIEQPFDPEYPDYKDLNIIINGINLSSFSVFDVFGTDLYPDIMFAVEGFLQDRVELQSADFVASALNTAGQLVYYNCSYVVASVYVNAFVGEQALQLNGSMLQVITWDNEFLPGFSVVDPNWWVCTGDRDLSPYVTKVLNDALNCTVSVTIPEYLADLNRKTLTVLNDILALRNVTDEGSATSSAAPVKARLDMENKLPAPDANRGMVKRAMKRRPTSFQTSVEKPRADRVLVKWAS